MFRTPGYDGGESGSCMSFSSEVKKELLRQYSSKKHCQLAEIAAMLCSAGAFRTVGGRVHIIFAAENEKVADKYIRLLELAAGIHATATHTSQLQQNHKPSCLALLTEAEDVKKISSMLSIMPVGGASRQTYISVSSETGQAYGGAGSETCQTGYGAADAQTVGLQHICLADGGLLVKSCCRRAFLRGAFLTAGSMSNPKKSYHFEIVCWGSEWAQQIKGQFRHFSLDAKVVSRKNHEIVYLKEGEQIVDALNIMGAHTALMDLENVRIIKEMRNDINRRVNCETANINKTVHAAYRQQGAIRFLQQRGVIPRLSRQLQEIALLRMEHPEATIQELGTMCSPQVGKSGVNHRLRKLEEAAKQMGYEKGATAHADEEAAKQMGYAGRTEE